MEKQPIDFSGVTGLLDALVREGQIPGIAVGLYRDDGFVWKQAAGYANLERQTLVDPENTIFRIASASKPIAATALAIMVSDGLIDLDASFYDYVPYYPQKEYDFTIRQLASHTAGIRAYRGKEFALNKPISIKQSIDVFKEDPLLFKPGTSYLYNSYDWVLISLAMQEVSGLAFEDYVNQKVFHPLGMKHTFPEIPKKSLKHKAEFYTKARSGFRTAVAVDNRYKLAGGGYLSTISDLMQLGRSYLHGELPDPAWRSDFLSATTIGGSSTYYGLGWEVSRDRSGRKFYGHTGSSVGAYSNFYIYPEEGAVVVILINCTDPKVQLKLDAIIDLMLNIQLIA